MSVQLLAWVNQVAATSHCGYKRNRAGQTYECLFFANNRAQEVLAQGSAASGGAGRPASGGPSRQTSVSEFAVPSSPASASRMQLHVGVLQVGQLFDAVPAEAATPAPATGASNKPAAKQAAKAQATTNATAPTANATAATISIDDFARLDLRIGKVLACEAVEGSDKLLRFELDAGPLGRRQIFSGIRAAYAEPAQLVGRNVVFIANLAPRKMRFGLSEGMILSAGDGGADLFLLDADQGAKPGATVR